MGKRPKPTSPDTDAQAAKTPTRRTALPVRIALIVGGVLVALLLAEGLLRWVFPYQFIYKHPQFIILNDEPVASGPQVANALLAPALTVTDQPWRYGLKPNLRARFVSSEFDVAFETNDEGLRGPPLQARPDLRILGLGDSFAMGFGVEHDETYLSVLARRRQEQTDAATEAVNAGVIGYNPYNSAQLLFSRAATLRPDVVILQLWAGNDLCSRASAARPIVQDEERLTLKALLRRWHLGMLVRDRLRAFTPVRHWLIERGLINRYAIDQLLSVDMANRCARRLDALSTLLAEIDAFCREQNMRFVLLLIPVREQIYEGDWQRAVEYDGVAVDPPKIDFDAPSRVLRRIAEDHGLTLFDATETLRSHQDGDRLYFDGLDPHLTPRGHAVIGTALFRFLYDDQ